MKPLTKPPCQLTESTYYRNRVYQYNQTEYPCEVLKKDDRLYDRIGYRKELPCLLYFDKDPGIGKFHVANDFQLPKMLLAKRDDLMVRFDITSEFMFRRSEMPTRIKRLLDLVPNMCGIQRGIKICEFVLTPSIGMNC